MRATPINARALDSREVEITARSPLQTVLLASIASAGIVAVAGLAYLYRPLQHNSIADARPLAALADTGAVAAKATPSAASVATAGPAAVAAAAPAAGGTDDSAALMAARAAAERQLASVLSNQIAPASQTSLVAQTNSAQPAAAPATSVAALTPAAPASSAANAAPAAAPVVAALTPPDASNAPASPSTNIVLSPADLQRLAEKAAEAIRTGDIAGARLVLERAEEGGDVTAIYALAQTFDPRVLQQMRVQGLKGDAAKARQLYQQALDAGVTDAKDKLSGL